MVGLRVCCHVASSPTSKGSSSEHQSAHQVSLLARASHVELDQVALALV